MKIADEIIDAVCAEFGVVKEQLLQSGIRTPAVLAARDAAVRRLKAQHFSAAWIARFLHLSLHAVNCRLYPGTKAAQKRAQARFHAERKAMRQLARESLLQ
mgnify:CR=1 FL=1